MTAAKDNGRELAVRLLDERLSELAQYYREERPDDPVRLADVLLANACVLNGEYAKADEPLERVMRDLDGRMDADGDSDGFHPNREMRFFVELEAIREQVKRLAGEVAK